MVHSTPPKRKWRYRSSGRPISGLLLNTLWGLSLLIGFALIINALLLLEIGDNDQTLFQRGLLRSRIQRYVKLALFGRVDERLAADIDEDFNEAAAEPRGLVYRKERAQLQPETERLNVLWRELRTEQLARPGDNGKMLAISEELWTDGRPLEVFKDSVQRKKKIIFVLLLAVMCLSLVVAVLLSRLSVSRIRHGLEFMAFRDALTRIGNRRFGQEALNSCLELAEKHHEAFILCIFDVDHFKNHNDHGGHGLGDLILKKIAGKVQENLRSDDVFIRHGGDEFMLILMESRISHAAALCRRLLSEVELLGWPHGEKVTLSMGCALSRQSDTPDEIIKRADEALYRAKVSGRNRIVWASDGGESSPG